ncbi:MAG TPA: glycosyltransferase family A protein [Mycobacteriales bacterium]|jgi:glycosyltransferase involved in cell wall biosynthesis|nr:glycosyltransferase family A protein [Mycobacteriales bacterium]
MRIARAVRHRLTERGVDGQLELWRERIEAREHRELLARARAGRDVCWTEPEGEAEPLVTIRIPTYNRSDALAEVSLPSALRQTYERIEVLVVGDATDAATDRYMASVRDPRVRYVNLPRGGLYPTDPALRWRVSGTYPMNAALVLARGDWIAPCDDDDELTDDHVEVLLREAKRRRLELVHSVTETFFADGRHGRLGAPELTVGQVTHGSVLYSMGLRFLTYSPTCYRIPEPHDWNLWRRMRDLGVRIGFADHVTYRYYATRASSLGAPEAKP